MSVCDNVNLSIKAQAEPNKENVFTGLTVCPLLCSFSFVFLVSICTLWNSCWRDCGSLVFLVSMCTLRSNCWRLLKFCLSCKYLYLVKQLLTRLSKSCDNNNNNIDNNDNYYYYFYSTIFFRRATHTQEPARTSVCVYTCIYVCVYVWRERERERERWIYNALYTIYNQLKADSKQGSFSD